MRVYIFRYIETRILVLWGEGKVHPSIPSTLLVIDIPKTLLLPPFMVISQWKVIGSVGGANTSKRSSGLFMLLLHCD